MSTSSLILLSKPILKKLLQKAQCLGTNFTSVILSGNFYHDSIL